MSIWIFELTKRKIMKKHTQNIYLQGSECIFLLNGDCLCLFSRVNWTDFCCSFIFDIQVWNEKIAMYSTKISVKLGAFLRCIFIWMFFFLTMGNHFRFNNNNYRNRNSTQSNSTPSFFSLCYFNFTEWCTPNQNEFQSIPPKKKINHFTALMLLFL